jgi:hypothetical protein
LEGTVNDLPRLAIIALALLPLWTSGGCADRRAVDAEPDAEPPHDAPTVPGESETLLSVMAGLRADMIRLNEGLWTGDFRGVAGAAESVAEHPAVSPAERLRVQAALGDEFPSFVAADQHLHALALRVRDAALREDTTEVLTSLSALQHGCIACHTAFRERLTP